MDLHKLIEKGLQRDVVIYDNWDYSGLLTEKLFMEMTQFHCKETGRHLKCFLVPYWVAIPLSAQQYVLFDIPKDLYKLVLQKYATEGGKFPPGRENLVIGFDEEENVILGAF